jgi:hypothetical protein
MRRGGGGMREGRRGGMRREGGRKRAGTRKETREYISRSVNMPWPTMHQDLFE